MMQKQDFYELPRLLQDRFIESSQAVAAPAPLAVLPRASRSALVWGLGAVALAVFWAFLTTVGFGDLKSPHALGSLVHQGVSVALAGAITFCAVRAFSVSWALSRLPYGSGDYLFPSGVISANGPILVFHDAINVQSVEAVQSRVLVKFKGGESFSFPATSAPAAALAVASFESGCATWQELGPADSLERARLNPLLDSGVSNPLAPTLAYELPRMMGKLLFGAVVVVAALGLGLGVSDARDAMSRKALYKSAVSKNSVEAFKDYLARGGKRAEVKSLLLPRAELNEAVGVATVSAIETFRDKNPDLEINAEVEAALRAALLRELEKARATGSLTAIDEVPKRFKDHQLIAGEIMLARQAVFVKAQEDFRAQASDKLEDLLPFMHRLLTYSQVHGPTVELRFEHKFPQEPKKLNQIVANSKKYYMGTKSLPVQYFLGEPARRREKALLEKFAKRFQMAFPKDILHFKLGAPPAGENIPAPPPTVPTLTFSHRERLSGSFVGGKPKAMYLSTAALLTVQGEVPSFSGKGGGGLDKVAPQVVFKWNAWRRPNFKVLTDPAKDIPDVYENMVTGIFDKFYELYVERWFLEP